MDVTYLPKFDKQKYYLFVVIFQTTLSDKSHPRQTLKTHLLHS